MTKRYLIVDDDARARRMIQLLLAEAEIEFSEAQDGGEAVQLYQMLRPDFVIMDLEMRPMDGLTATRRIREFDAGSRVIIVSQHDSRQVREAAASSGAQAYVPKEHLSELKRLISEWPAKPNPTGEDSNGIPPTPSPNPNLDSPS